MVCRVSAQTTRRHATTDACPGVARPFEAADGAIVRLRPAARPVRVSALATLMEIVAAQVDPSMQLTSRGALQLRGLPTPLSPDVAAAISGTGLVPSASHELVRNIVASPLSGLDGEGHCDLRPMVAALDAALCSEPTFAKLPGRFLFALDDGRGDVIHEAFDLGVLATGPGGGVVVVGGSAHGWAVPLDAAVPELLGLAREFVRRVESETSRRGESVWHVSELDSAWVRHDDV